jgi:hypothetical protein
MRLAAVLLSAAAALGLAQPAPAPTVAAPRPARIALPQGPIRSLLAVDRPLRYGEWRWDERGAGPGPLWVRVDRRAQILSVFRGADEIATAVILYGAPEQPTPAGRYPIRAKSRAHRSLAYGADMPFSLWLTPDGVALHGSDVRAGAATHGCVGLPPEFARRLFDAASVGDPVLIV